MQFHSTELFERSEFSATTRTHKTQVSVSRSFENLHIIYNKLAVLYVSIVNQSFCERKSYFRLKIVNNAVGELRRLHL